jgi:hypothetical protein
LAVDRVDPQKGAGASLLCRPWPDILHALVAANGNAHALGQVWLQASGTLAP